MKLTLYLDGNTGPEISTVNARLVYIDPRMKTCIHRTPFDRYRQKEWVVSEVTTSFRIGKNARTQLEAIEQAKSRMKYISDESIKTAMNVALNKTSDIGEYLAGQRSETIDDCHISE